MNIRIHRTALVVTAVSALVGVPVVTGLALAADKHKTEALEHAKEAVAQGKGKHADALKQHAQEALKHAKEAKKRPACGGSDQAPPGSCEERSSS